MEHLLAAWPKVLEQIQKARQILFLSDFDGTLTPIVEKPELAILPEATRSLLQELAFQRHLTVGLISGRALADLKARANLDGVIYAGNHGFEIEGPGIIFVNPLVDEIKPFFRIIRQILILTLGTIKGVLVEDKGITLSVHYRQVEEARAREIKGLVEQAISGMASQVLFKVTSGKKVFEVRPSIDWDKGKAIRLLMKKYGKGGKQSGLLPIYLGDDLTDEDGFRIIEKYGAGITVHIGEPGVHSLARYFLHSPEEVHNFLIKLLDHSQRGLLCEQCSIPA
jgi:trehalose 6-phosphate phosphatase